MNKYIKIFGYVIISIIGLSYLIFLCVLPLKINLDIYKPEIQKVFKETTNLDIEFDRVKFTTTPLLEIGIKTNNITIKNPTDNSTVLNTKSKWKNLFTCPFVV